MNVKYRATKFRFDYLVLFGYFDDKAFIINKVKMKINPKFILMALLVITMSCDEDLVTDERTNAEKFIGNWTTNEVDVTMEVGSLSLFDHLTTNLGLTPSEAEVIKVDLETLFAAEVTGTLIIDAAGTFTSGFNGISSSGSWSIAADDKSVTLIEVTTEVVNFVIDLITDEVMIVTIADDFQVDLDEDEATAEETVSVSAVVEFDRI